MKWRLIRQCCYFQPSSLILSIEDRFKHAALRVGSDLDEEDVHLAKIRIAHFVGALGQSQIALSAKRNAEWLSNIRRLIGSPLLCLDQFYRQHAIRENDLEILVEAGSELFLANGGEVEHGRISHEGHKGTQRFCLIFSNFPFVLLCDPRVRNWLRFCFKKALDSKALSVV